MTVLLLHAFPLDERMWEPQFGALGATDAVAPRLYGRGPSLDRWAAEILNEVDGPLIVVGASMGGYAGSRWRPGRPSECPACCSSARGPAPTRPSGGVTAMC